MIYNPDGQRRHQPPQQAWPARQQPQPYSGKWPPPRPELGPRPVPQPHRIRVARRRGPYPSHLTRFPAELIPGARRRRGTSIWRLVWLGTHPVAALISFVISIYALMLVLGWIMLVVAGWGLWVGVVSLLWACSAIRSTAPRR